jgi:hypothetical protein
MNIDESMITSEPKYPLAVPCSFISLNLDGELKEAGDSLGIVLENLDSFVINRWLTLDEIDTLAKNGFIITTRVAFYDGEREKVEIHVERNN